MCINGTHKNSSQLEFKNPGGFQVGMLTIHLIKKWPTVFQTNMKVRAEQYNILFI